MMLNDISLLLINIMNNLIFMCIILSFSFIRSLNIIIKSAISILIIGLVNFVPIFKGFSLVWILRGIASDFSITTLLVLVGFYINKLINTNYLIISQRFAWIIFSSGLLLYLSTFGVINFDIYDLGNYPLWVLGIFIGIEIFLWYGSKLNALFWLLALIGFYYKLQLSLNLWSYLFDPILWFISIFCLLFSKKRK